MKITQWHGCYDGNQSIQKEIFTKASLAHPAKMSIALTERIIEHGQEQGYWQPGDLIIDPFGGIGTTGIIAAYRGYPVFSVELEQNFVELGNANIEKNRSKLKRLNLPIPQLVQGDSRRLAEIIGQGKGAVSSPPFINSVADGGWQLLGKYAEEGKLTVKQAKGNPNQSYPSWDKDRDTSYGKSEGQVGVMPEGDHGKTIASITSPPYSEARIGESSGAAQVGHGKNYGQADGQLGSMKEGDIDQVIGGITGPPCEDSLKGINEGGIDMDKSAHSFGPNSQVAGALSSPPWEDNLSADRVDPNQRRDYARSVQESNAEHISPIDMEKVNGRPQKDAQYGQSPGQIGAESGDSYWQSVSEIYQQVYQLLPPGGVFAVVLKDFVRNKKRVPLCDQTAELLQAIGFNLVERVHAMLVKDIQQPINMFTGVATPKRVERKSFFRRLAENKGSPKIDYEVVLFARKP